MMSEEEKQIKSAMGFIFLFFYFKKLATHSKESILHCALVYNTHTHHKYNWNENWKKQYSPVCDICDILWYFLFFSFPFWLGPTKLISHALMGYKQQLEKHCFNEELLIYYTKVFLVLVVVISLYLYFTFLNYINGCSPPGKGKETNNC